MRGLEFAAADIHDPVGFCKFDFDASCCLWPGIADHRAYGITGPLKGRSAVLLQRKRKVDHAGAARRTGCRSRQCEGNRAGRVECGAYRNDDYTAQVLLNFRYRVGVRAVLSVKPQLGRRAAVEVGHLRRPAVSGRAAIDDEGEVEEVVGRISGRAVVVTGRNGDAARDVAGLVCRKQPVRQNVEREQQNNGKTRVKDRLSHER